jgi:hypothetical protein
MSATLHLRSITCYQQAETGYDELYLTFTGKKISLEHMTRGDTHVLSGDYDFDGSAPLTLFENDGDHWYDRDDFIDSHTIDESQPPGDFPLIYHASSGNAKGARYELMLNVTRVA